MTLEDRRCDVRRSFADHGMIRRARRAARALASVTLLLAATVTTGWPQTGAEGPRVKLLDPGQAPRRPLRYTAAAGDQRSAVVSTRMTQEMSRGGTRMPANLVPETRMTMDVKVTKVTPDGVIRYDFTLGSTAVETPGVPPAVVQAVKANLEAMGVLNGVATVNSRGFIQEAETDIRVPPGASPQIKQLIESIKPSVRQFASPLPEEPVGPGARWETTARIEMAGMSLEQSATNQLASVIGNRVKIVIGLTQSAKPQKISPPGLPPGANIELLSYEGKGEGEVEIDLSRLVPSASKMELTSNARMRVTVQGQDQEIGMTTTVTMTIGEK